jgi:hypothetical protein
VTTIAWDGRTIAADRRTAKGMSVGKLFRLKDGSIVAGAGFHDQVVEIVAWIKGGCRESKRPALPDSDPESSDLLIACPDGTAYWLTWPYLRRVKVIEGFAAVGSGAEYAIGALEMGASAAQAVEIAARHDDATGNGVDVLSVTRSAA